MIKIGSRYTFVGFKESDGFAEVRWENVTSQIVEPGKACRFLWVLIVRSGHCLDGKEVPFTVEGKHIGTWKAQFPNLDQEIIDAV